MNERIQELALEAFDPINAMASEGVADRHTFDQAWFQLYNKKFAELIVWKCAGIATYPELGDEESYYGNEFAKAIKKHFGVEE